MAAHGWTHRETGELRVRTFFFSDCLSFEMQKVFSHFFDARRWLTRTSARNVEKAKKLETLIDWTHLRDDSQLFTRLAFLFDEKKIRVKKLFTFRARHIASAFFPQPCRPHISQFVALLKPEYSQIIFFLSNF